MERVKEAGGEGEGRKEETSCLPLPHLSFFGACPIFRAAKAPKIPFLGLSLLPNPTETLAAQAGQKILEPANENRARFDGQSCTGFPYQLSPMQTKAALPIPAVNFTEGAAR